MTISPPAVFRVDVESKVTPAVLVRFAVPPPVVMAVPDRYTPESEPLMTNGEPPVAIEPPKASTPRPPPVLLPLRVTAPVRLMMALLSTTAEFELSVMPLRVRGPVPVRLAEKSTMTPPPPSGVEFDCSPVTVAPPAAFRTVLPAMLTPYAQQSTVVPLMEMLPAPASTVSVVERNGPCERRGDVSAFDRDGTACRSECGPRDIHRAGCGAHLHGARASGSQR